MRRVGPACYVLSAIRATIALVALFVHRADIGRTLAAAFRRRPTAEVVRPQLQTVDHR